MDEPRQRLIEAGLDLFGKYSFDGASTRMLAERAEVNLAAIKYYFGGKEGLYLAVADEIVEQVDGLLGPQLAKIRLVLQRESVSRERSFNLLCELLEFLITRFPYHYMLIFGIIMVVAILYMPNGLVELIQQIWKKLSRRFYADT